MSKLKAKKYEWCKRAKKKHKAKFNPVDSIVKKEQMV